ncbi:MAG: methylmalonyl-CoA mutase [Puniceicoccaceae bacterium]|nr:MAG: methylmalonyl-CoA mutase [Puniceicoccaceae bacterium]
MSHSSDTTTPGPEGLDLKRWFPPPEPEAWRRAAEEALAGAPFEKRLVTPTPEGIALQPIYNREALAGLGFTAAAPGAGLPVRGGTATGYLTRPWRISQELPYSTPEEFNRAARLDVERGQTELNILLDLATQDGRDADHAEPTEVGACGLSVCTVGDLERAFDGIDLARVSLYLRTAASGLPMAALLLAWAEKRGLEATALTGCIESDPLGTLAWRGRLTCPLTAAYAEMAELTRFASAHAPNLQTIVVQGHPYHDGGASASQELAFVLATGVEYLRRLLDAGLSLEQIAPRVRLAFSIGSNFFMEAAKLRVGRMLWARVLEAYGAPAELRRAHLHARTSLWNKTRLDPFVNVLRGTTEAFSAVVGGCDSLHVGPFDEVSRLPDDFSRRLARNTQIILQEECQLTGVVDPAGGSWYLEKLTDELADKAWAAFQEIESGGGIARALEAGRIQESVTALAAKRRAALAARREVQVGVNNWPNARELPLEPRLPDYVAIHRRRARQVADFRVAAGAEAGAGVLAALQALLDAPADEKPAAAIAAAKAGASLGEITRSLRGDQPEAVAFAPIPAGRGSEGFEILRRAAWKHADAAGSAPKLFQANLQPSRLYRLRADWTSSFFQVGGFEVLADQDFATVEEAAPAFIESGARIAVIVSSDETYPASVPALARLIKARDPECCLLVAGAPGDQEAAFREAGVDDFVHVRVNAHDLLSRLLTQIGALS